MKCVKCVMPDTKPGITFRDGVCNACQTAEKNDRTDWDRQWEIFKGKIKCAQPKGYYHCVIPVSGGKDSTFLAFKARELGLNPLCVNVRPSLTTTRGVRNLENLSRQGFDIFSFIPNQKIMPVLTKRSFYEDGDPCTSHEFMLYSVPVKVAMQYKIPFVIWGENNQTEYGNADLQCGLWGRQGNHWICDSVTENDLISFQQPTSWEIGIAGVQVFYLGDYMRWDSRKIAKFSISHGMEVRHEHELLGTGGYWDFEQLDDEMPVIGHYLKYQKFGYGRATDQACRDIRLGYITRKEGLALVKKYDGYLNRHYIKRFCKYIGISAREFHKVCQGFYRNPVVL